MDFVELCLLLEFCITNSTLIPSQTVAQLTCGILLSRVLALHIFSEQNGKEKRLQK